MSEESLAIERAFASQLARDSLTPDGVDRWEACRSSHRFMAYKGKDLIIYTLIDGVPKSKSTHSCRFLSVNLEDGFKSEWKTSTGGVYYVTHEPREVANGCFIWHPFSSCVQYPEYNYRRNVRFSVCFKTTANPHTKRDNLTYILERSVFEDIFKGM